VWYTARGIFRLYFIKTDPQLSGRVFRRPGGNIGMSELLPSGSNSGSETAREGCDCNRGEGNTKNIAKAHSVRVTAHHVYGDASCPMMGSKLLETLLVDPT
jgi:hypothetical protein